MKERKTNYYLMMIDNIFSCKNSTNRDNSKVLEKNMNLFQNYKRKSHVGPKNGKTTKLRIYNMWYNQAQSQWNAEPWWQRK